MLFSHQALADAPDLDGNAPVMSRWEVRTCSAPGHGHYFYDRETGRTCWSLSSLKDLAAAGPPPPASPRAVGGIDSAASSPACSPFPPASELEPLHVNKRRS
jgi:hypothetical protein